MKTVLFTPGFGETIDTRDYKSVLRAIEDKGYNVEFIPIQWTRTVIDDWVRQLQHEYNKHDPAQTILAGFSYGAMTSFVAATHRTPADLWLFSLSPYFAEDIPHIKKWWAHMIGKRRIAAFREISFNDLATRISCPTTITVGELEPRLLVNRCHDAHRAIKNSKLFVVPHVRHNIADTHYIQMIQNTL